MITSPMVNFLFFLNDLKSGSPIILTPEFDIDGPFLGLMILGSNLTSYSLLVFPMLNNVRLVA